jgi:hypothetical protein
MYITELGSAGSADGCYMKPLFCVRGVFSWCDYALMGPM